jgi:hypothetical protein
VPKGSTVTLKLINNVPSDPKEHGFAIPAYNIAETVVRGEPKTVTFTADKVGVFPDHVPPPPRPRRRTAAWSCRSRDAARDGRRQVDGSTFALPATVLLGELASLSGVEPAVLS